MFLWLSEWSWVSFWTFPPGEEEWKMACYPFFLSQSWLLCKVYLQIMFCNHTWMVAYTWICNCYFHPGNSFEKRTVAMAARSENESRVVLKAPALEPVFRRLSRLQASLSLWARSGQSYLCLKVFLGVYMYVSKYVCVSMSVKLSLNYMYVSYFFVCNKGRDWETSTQSSYAPKLFCVAIKQIHRKASFSGLDCKTGSPLCF